MQVSFLIYAHAPYVRHSGFDPLGEDELHELIIGSLLPLLNLIHELRGGGLESRLALVFSPVLIEQLADPVIQKHCLFWCEAKMRALEARLRHAQDQHDSHGAYLGRFYLERLDQLLRAFQDRYNRNILKEFRELAQQGAIEILAAPASFAPLSWPSSEVMVRAQIEIGMLTTMRHLGKVQGLWLPEGAWRNGLERGIGGAGLSYTVVGAEWLGAGEPPHPAWIVPQAVAGLAPDPYAPGYVIAPDLGYRGDPLYRDSSRSNGDLAWGLNDTQPYDPYHAFGRAQEHASHFAGWLASEAAVRTSDDLLLVALDAALLGREWFEGPAWLQHVLIICGMHGNLNLSHPGAHLRRRRPRPLVTPHPAPRMPPNEEVVRWELIHQAEERFLGLVRQPHEQRPLHERLLNQAARELLLAQAPSWSVPCAHDFDPDSAERWQIHLSRFWMLEQMLNASALTPADLDQLDEIEEDDAAFPDLNFRIFARQLGS